MFTVFIHTHVSVEFAERIRPISVVSARPLYGPVAGGTRVTITGQLPPVSIITDIFFGQHQGIIDKYRLPFCFAFYVFILPYPHPFCSNCNVWLLHCPVGTYTLKSAV